MYRKKHTAPAMFRYRIVPAGNPLRLFDIDPIAITVYRQDMEQENLGAEAW